MRFAIIASADAGTIHDEDKRLAVANDAERHLNDWIDHHFDQMVTCSMCGDRGRVHTDAENDLVVNYIPKSDFFFVACESCLAAFLFASVAGMEAERAQRLASRLMVEVVEQSKREAAGGMTTKLSQMAVINLATDLIGRETVKQGDVPPVSAAFRDAMRGKKYDA